MLSELFVTDDFEHLMVTQYMGAVPTSILKRETLSPCRSARILPVRRTFHD
jgi:hypothetical protein